METSGEQPLKVLKEQITDYIELKSEYARLGLIENSAKITAYFSSAIIIIALLTLFLLSLFVAVSFFLGQLLHSYGLGFLVSSGIYLLLLILFVSIWRKKSELSIMNKIIKLTSEDGNN